jgi:hypothetical protein
MDINMWKLFEFTTDKSPTAVSRHLSKAGLASKLLEAQGDWR